MKPIMLPVSRGILEHKDRMGPAIWEFLWFIDKVTEDVPDGAGKFNGIVLGGHPVSLAQIAGDLKEAVITTRRNVAALESAGYIIRQRLPENRCGYMVTNSIKWIQRDRRAIKNDPTREIKNDLTVANVRSEMIAACDQKCADRAIKNDPANKETLQELTKDLTEKQNTAPDGALDSLPDWIPLENWQGFVDLRKRMRAPLTSRAIKLTIAKLRETARAGTHAG